MKTTETDILAIEEKRAWQRIKESALADLRRMKCEERAGRMALMWCAAGDNYLDRMALAIWREREHRRAAVPVPECESVWVHTFECVCCGKVRGEQDRREPDSEVCVFCEREAGFWN
jgi:hypothetical protein